MGLEDRFEPPGSPAAQHSRGEEVPLDRGHGSQMGRLPRVPAPQRVLDTFHLPEFADQPPTEVYATLLDRDTYASLSRTRSTCPLSREQRRFNNPVSGGSRGVGLSRGSRAQCGTGVALLAKLSYSHKVFARVDEACSWFWSTSALGRSLSRALNRDNRSSCSRGGR